MDLRNSLITMLKQLSTDMQELQQQGAGYYTCIPIAKRYNKLMEQSRTLFNSSEALISTFEPLPEEDPRDPSSKMKRMQEIRIEIGQLVSLLESTNESEKT